MRKGECKKLMAEIVEKSLIINRMGLPQTYIHRTALHDAGRGSSKRVRQKNDCTVRAIATATRITYDEAYELLAKAGRACSKGFAFAPWADKAVVNGCSFQWQILRKQRGKARVNIAVFCKQYGQGTYIIKVRRHVLTVIDGMCHDCFISDGLRAVEGFWRVVRANDRSSVGT